MKSIILYDANGRKVKPHHRRRSTPKVIGYVLYQTEEIAIIATLKTRNRKTGKMIQIWIINRNISPMDALQSGASSAICFDCPHMGDGTGKKRTCYVNLRYVQAVWKAYQRGRYEYLPMSEYARVFAGKAIRFGAYGEPVLLPIAHVEALAAVASRWTGYTHQWRRAEFAAYRAFLMASCDSERDARVQSTAAEALAIMLQGYNRRGELAQLTADATPEASRVLLQALVVGSIGYCLGIAMTAAFFEITKNNLDLRGFYLLPQIMGLVAGAVLVIILLASAVSVRRVAVLEPAVVFRG